MSPGGEPSPTLAKEAATGPLLITGAAGFIGQRLASALCSDGLEVRALVRPEHDTRALEAVGARIVRGDASDARTVTDAAAGCQVIFHLAAARGKHKLGRRGYQVANRRLSEAVGRAALAVAARRVVVASSATLTGSPGPHRQTEDTPARPNSGYRASRLDAEHVFEALRQRDGLKVVMARVPQRVMGPGAHEWTRPVRAVRDGAFRFLPEGGSIHSGDVDDVVDGLRLCGVVPGVDGQRFLLGAAEPMPTVMVLQTIADHLNVPFAPRMLPAAPFRAYVALGNLVYRSLGLSLPHHFTADFYAACIALDIGRARQQLGYSPRFAMSESIARTVAWLRDDARI